MTILRARWDALVGALGIMPDVAERVWQVLTEAYSEPQRHYHSLAHIEAVTAHCESLSDQFKMPDTALLALFFHDIVYDPAKSDNESQSAMVLQDLLGGYVEVDVINRASVMIEATKHHKATPDPDTNLLLDIDMSILGAPWPGYLAYARGVAKEYLPVYGAEAYAAGRVSLFLTPTLEKPRLFLTDAFSRFEDQARENLRDERDLWASGTFDAA